MKINYENVVGLSLEITCCDTTVSQWDEFMSDATRGNKTAINKLIKKFLPDLYNALALNLRNPYNYYKTGKHLILVHSAIEYFLSYDVIN